MFAYISGTVDEIGPDRAVVEAYGVGWELQCSAATLRQLCVGKPAKLCTHFHVTQDGVALYGFFDAAERAMFRRLISVSRVGPKLALSVLSALSVSDVNNAVLLENAAAFDRVPGMGRKTAARVILELKGQLTGTFETTAAMDPASLDMRGEAVAALVSLGYDAAAAGRAVAATPECGRVEDMIASALKSMAPKG